MIQYSNDHPDKEGYAMIAQSQSISGIIVAVVLTGLANPALAQGGAAESPLLGMSEVVEVGRIGRVHDRIRRANLWSEWNQELTGLYGDYSRFKRSVTKATGLSWSLTTSYLQQWGEPDGGWTSGQILLTPGFDWTLFDSTRFGSGSLQASYTLVDYPWRQTAANIAENLGIITEMNDFPGSGDDAFDQLTYTQALPGNKLLLSIGQYPFYNFDGNQYLADQQQNFNSYVLAQNGSSTYPTAGLGAYAQVNLTSTLQLVGGFQNATNLSGANLSTRGLAGHNLAWIGYLQWTPRFRGLGSAQYAFNYYDVPTVPTQPRGTGWSFSGVQNLDDRWAVFGRANGAWGFTTPIRASYALGGAMNNPLGRSKTDQIGLAFGYSDAAGPPVNPAGARNEKLVELYWNWTLFGGLLLTPDVQYIQDPALNPERDHVWAFSLRTTLLL
ncbi:carbohydrate porin [Thiocapsa imhoffii]|nr:carbohydrate porin [Thiocapsa imhoffii]